MITLHLVRRGEPRAMAADDWIVYLHTMRLVQPPRPPHPIDHDELVRLLFAADRVVTW